MRNCLEKKGYGLLFVLFLPGCFYIIICFFELDKIRLAIYKTESCYAASDIY
jgi:uncharacterized membrane protein